MSAHEVQAVPRWARLLVWLWRGVTTDTYRQVCGRCGKTGQAHVSAVGACWRFKAPPALGR